MMGASDATSGRPVDDPTRRRLVALGAQHGTPLYVYDLTAIDANARRVQEALAGVELQIRYFEFANRNAAVLERVRRLGLGIATARPTGVERALRAGFAPEHVELSGFGLTASELCQAAERGISINVASISELTQAAALMPELPLGLRVDLREDADDKRGIPVSDLLAFMRAKPIPLAGIHTYLGTNISSSERHLRALREMVELLAALPAETTRELRYLNVGSGFGYDYDRRVHFGWREYGLAARQLIDAAAQRLGRRPILKLELGRALVVDAGYLVTRVVHAFRKRERVFLCVDSNLSHCGRPARYGFDVGHPPFSADGRHALVLAGAPAGAGAGGVEAAVVGNSHYSRDWFGFTTVPQADLAQLARCHVLVLDAGAYAEAMSDHWADEPRPAVVVLDGAGDRLVTEREQVADLLAARRQVAVPAELSLPSG